MMIGRMIKIRKRHFFQKNKQVFNNKVTNSLSKSNKAPPRSVLSKIGSGSSTASGRKSKRSMQTERKTISSSSFESALHDDSKLKVLKHKPVNVKGQPRIVMTWVPKSKYFRSFCRDSCGVMSSDLGMLTTAAPDT